VLKNASLTEADVSMTSVPDGALVSSYLQGAGGSVGILGGLDDKPAEIMANGGAQPVTFAYSDFGVNQVGYCIATAKKTISDNPDLVKRFVAATVKSYKAAEANPQAAIDALGDIVGGTMNEEAGKKQALAVQKVTLDVLYSKANTAKVLGLNVASDWSDMVDLMKKYNGLETAEPATAFYTNDFLPK
jgi:NitT/TauT family transport system substrate-binding protein